MPLGLFSNGGKRSSAHHNLFYVMHVSWEGLVRYIFLAVHANIH